MHECGHQNLHWLETGSLLKPAVLFLHGFMGRASEWKPVMDSLSSGFRCISVDLPGHGNSVGLSYPRCYTIEGAAEGLHNLLEYLNVKKCFTIGYSMGGRLALFFAYRYPERCSRLVLESASPGLHTHDERAERRRLDEARAKWLENEGMDVFLNDWYKQPVFASLHRQAGLVERLVSTKKHNDPFELARSLRAMGTGKQPSLWERLGDLRVSTLVMAGALDRKYSAIAGRMERLIPTIRTAIIPHAGHNVHVESPACFQIHLNDFFLDNHV